MELQFKYPPKLANREDWRSYEGYLKLIITNMPNHGVLTSDEQETVKQIVLAEYPSAKFDRTSIDYGYIGPVPYVVEGRRTPIIILIMSTMAIHSKNTISGDFQTPVNVLNLLYIDTDNGEMDLTLLTDDSSVKTITDTFRGIRRTQITYERHLEKLQNTIPDADLHGILNI